MLVLKEKDIYNLIAANDVIKAVERAYSIQHTGKYLMPDRIHLNRDGNTMLVMPVMLS